MASIATEKRAPDADRRTCVARCAQQAVSRIRQLSYSRLKPAYQSACSVPESRQMPVRMRASVIGRVSEPDRRSRHIASRVIIAYIRPQVPSLVCHYRAPARERACHRRAACGHSSHTAAPLHAVVSAARSSRATQSPRVERPKFDTFSCLDLCLAIQRKVISVLGNENMASGPGPANPRSIGRLGASACTMVSHLVQLSFNRTCRITLKRAGTYSSTSDTSHRAC
jgi:hypothetical protein